MEVSIKGFSLVELIIVIAILLIVSLLTVVAYGNIMQNSRDAAQDAYATVLAEMLNLHNSIADSDDYRVLSVTAAKDLFTGDVGTMPTTGTTGLSPLGIIIIPNHNDKRTNIFTGGPGPHLAWDCTYNIFYVDTWCGQHN